MRYSAALTIGAAAATIESSDAIACTKDQELARACGPPAAAEVGGFLR